MGNHIPRDRGAVFCGVPFRLQTCAIATPSISQHRPPTEERSISGYNAPFFCIVSQESCKRKFINREKQKTSRHMNIPICTPDRPKPVEITGFPGFFFDAKRVQYVYPGCLAFFIAQGNYTYASLSIIFNSFKYNFS